MAKGAHAETSFVLSLPCPPSTPYQDGRTALMVVKTPEVAQALIAAGANLEAKDKVSST